MGLEPTTDKCRGYTNLRVKSKKGLKCDWIKKQNHFTFIPCNLFYTHLYKSNLIQYHTITINFMKHKIFSEMWYECYIRVLVMIWRRATKLHYGEEQLHYAMEKSNYTTLWRRATKLHYGEEQLNYTMEKSN